MIDENHFTKYFRYNIWSHQPRNNERVDDVVLIPNYVNVSGLTGSKPGLFSIFLGTQSEVKCEKNI